MGNIKTDKLQAMSENNNKKKVVAIVVTYNRKALLQECINAIMHQTYCVDKIIVIDNASTDGTEGFLSELAQGNALLSSYRMEKNVGGAGGFSEGIKIASQKHSDWLWLMDDDTVPSPEALEKLMEYSDVSNVGFLNSMVEWIDGSPHVMNIPWYDGDKVKCNGQSFDTSYIRSVSCSSFVSILIKSEIPFKIGLPYKEFFIWCDDTEYTIRMRNSGYLGLHVLNSKVLHKTPTNYVGDLGTVTADKAWKMYYGERNGSFLKRQRKGFFLFFFSQLNTFRLHRRKIKKRKLQKDDEKKLLNAIYHGLWDGFTFNPKIEYIDM